MGMFAETAIVNYYLLFADQGKQTSVFHFRFPFPFSAYIYIYWNISIYICCHFKYWFGKRNYIYKLPFRRKMEDQAISLNLYTNCTSCKRKFVICPFVDKEILGSYTFTNGINGPHGLAHLCLCDIPGLFMSLISPGDFAWGFPGSSKPKCPLSVPR